MELLGLNKLSSRGLEKAYKDKAKIFHPDNKITGDSNKFITIKNAYDELKKICKQKIIMKINVSDIIKEIYVPYEELVIVVSPLTIRQLIFNKTTFNGKEFVVQIKNDNGFRLKKSGTTCTIVKDVNITLDDIRKGRYVLSIGEKQIEFKIPMSGVLSSKIALSNKVYLKVNYHIKKEG